MRLSLGKDLCKMKSMIRALFIFSFLILSANVAYPCTCLQISHRKEFRQAAAIFAGQVLGISEDKSFVPPKLNDSKISREALARFQKMIDSQKRYVVRFLVEKKFKGVGGKEITLYTYQSDGPCSGIVFTEGERYLIYANRNEEGLTDGGLCSRTRKLDETSKEYRELNSFWFQVRSRLPLLG
jgi:hypothetical protein